MWLILTFFGGTIVTIIAGYLAPYGANGTADQQVANANMANTLFGLLPNGMFARSLRSFSSGVNTFNLIAPSQTGHWPATPCCPSSRAF